MSCCCDKHETHGEAELKSFDGMGQTVGGGSVESLAFRFLVPEGCVLDEASGVWSRLVAAPGYDSLIVQDGPVIRTDVEPTALLRVEQFSSVNSAHAVKQRWDSYTLVPVSQNYSEVIFAWYSQLLAGWQALLKCTDAAYAFVTTGTSGSEVVFQTEEGVWGLFEVLDTQNPEAAVWFEAFETSAPDSEAGTFEIINGDDATKTPWLYKVYRSGGGYVPYYLAVDDLTFATVAGSIEPHIGHPGFGIRFQVFDGLTYLPAAYTPGTILDVTIDGTEYTYEVQVGETAQQSVQELADLIPNAIIVEHNCGLPRYLVIQFPLDWTNDHTASSTFWGDPVLTWPEADPLAPRLTQIGLDVRSGDLTYGWGYGTQYELVGVSCVATYAHTIFTFVLDDAGTMRVLTAVIETSTPGPLGLTSIKSAIGLTDLQAFTKDTNVFFGDGDGEAYGYAGAGYTIYTSTEPTVDQPFTTQGVRPAVNRRYQPNWGVTSTGFVSLGNGTEYRYVASGLTANFAASPYFHYTLADDRVWATKIIEDPSYPDYDLLCLDRSDAGGVGGIDPVNGTFNLLHEKRVTANRWGDVFSDANGAYALHIVSDEVAGVLFADTVDTFWLRNVCKADCVIECRTDDNPSDDEEAPDTETDRVVWYTTCAEDCDCLPEHAPGVCTTDNIGRLTHHTCLSIGSSCPEGGTCLYRLFAFNLSPGEEITHEELAQLIFLGLATLSREGGDCQCQCPCPSVALVFQDQAIQEAGSITNGSIVQAQCFYDPYFDASCLPPPYDCEGAGSLVNLNVDLVIACHTPDRFNLPMTGPAQGPWSIADYEVPDSDGCLFIDAEMACLGGGAAAAIATLVVRNEDGSCSETYTRYARHAAYNTNLYQVSITDLANECCCVPCRPEGYYASVTATFPATECVPAATVTLPYFPSFDDNTHIFRATIGDFVYQFRYSCSAPTLAIWSAGAGDGSVGYQARANNYTRIGQTGPGTIFFTESSDCGAIPTTGFSVDSWQVA